MSGRRSTLVAVDTDGLRRFAAHCWLTASVSSNLFAAADAIDQALQPWMAFGEPVCLWCGESPFDNNMLRRELLGAVIKQVDTDGGLTKIELTKALEKANMRIAALNLQLQEGQT